MAAESTGEHFPASRGGDKSRLAGSEWDLLVSKRLRDVNDSVFRLLDRVKKEAIEARDRGDRAKVDALRTQVSAWGVPQVIKEFREAVDE